MSTPKLSTIQLYVLMEDGAEFTVQTRNPDMLRWDKTRIGKHWPTFQDAPFLGLTFLAWAALTREHQTVLPWDEFEKRCMHCQEMGTDAVDPTHAEAAHDS